MKWLKKVIFNFLNLHICSSVGRVRLFKLFGAYVGDGTVIEQVSILNYTGTNLNNLWIGDKVYFGMNCILDLKEKLTIGNSTKIAAGCNFSTHVDCGEENPIYSLYPRRKEPIKVGNHCWIGLSAIILCGTVIGDNTIIGAGSLVNKCIPPNVLAFGNPIRVQKDLTLLLNPSEILSDHSTPDTYKMDKKSEIMSECLRE